MRIEKSDIPYMMKYVAFAAIIVFIIVMMLFMSGSNKSFSEVKTSVEGALDASELTEQDAASFRRSFGLNEADYAGVAYYSAGSSILASEVLLIRVDNDSQVRTVTDAIDSRIESRKNDFASYIPEQYALLENAKISVRGNYIFYAVSEKADDYLIAFSGSL